MERRVSKHELDKRVNGRIVERHWNMGCILCNSDVQSNQPASKSGGAYQCTNCGLTLSTSARESSPKHYIVQDSWVRLDEDEIERLSKELR